MLKENYVAKQQRIGQRPVARDGQGPHGARRTRRNDGLQ
jgi:hypothetical protein